MLELELGRHKGGVQHAEQKPRPSARRRAMPCHAVRAFQAPCLRQLEPMPSPPSCNDNRRRERIGAPPRVPSSPAARGQGQVSPRQPGQGRAGGRADGHHDTTAARAPGSKQAGRQASKQASKQAAQARTRGCDAMPGHQSHPSPDSHAIGLGMTRAWLDQKRGADRPAQRGAQNSTMYLLPTGTSAVDAEVGCPRCFACPAGNGLENLNRIAGGAPGWHLACP